MYGFVFTMIATNQFSLNDSNTWLRKIYLLFFFKNFLVSMLLFKNNDLDAKSAEILSSDYVFLMSIRLICASVLHIIIANEILTSLKMGRFLRCHYNQKSLAY
jgi:hypothetical protein